MKFQQFNEIQRRARTLRPTMGWRNAFRTAWAATGTASRSQEVHFKPLDLRLSLRPTGSDLECYEKVFVQREYLVPFRCEPEFVVDAGANIGMATVFFKQQYPNAKILAIEPESANFELLKRNCEALAGISLFNGALWPRHEALHIPNRTVESWEFSVEPTSGQSPISEVNCITIPDILKDSGHSRIDILKLDIEAAELDLFAEGAEEWLGRVDILIVELHDRIRPGCSMAFYRALQHWDFHQESRGENVFVRLKRMLTRVDAHAAGE